MTSLPHSKQTCTSGKTNDNISHLVSLASWCISCSKYWKLWVTGAAIFGDFFHVPVWSGLLLNLQQPTVHASSYVHHTHTHTQATETENLEADCNLICSTDVGWVAIMKPYWLWTERDKRGRKRRWWWWGGM